MAIFDPLPNNIDSIIPDYEPSWEAVLETTTRPLPYRDGLHVAVFDDAAHGLFVCYGVIVSREWNVWTGDYSYNIQVCHSKRQLDTWGWLITPATPTEMRLGFRRIEGGFPELTRKQ